MSNQWRQYALIMAATGLAVAPKVPQSGPRTGSDRRAREGDFLNVVTNKMLARGWRPRPLGQGWPKVKVAR